MISLLQQLAIDKCGGAPATAYRIVKISSPGSGRGLYNKLLFLLFENNKALAPTFVAKTVRTPGENQVIERGFDRLQRAYRDVCAATYPWMIAQPLYLHTQPGRESISFEAGVEGRAATLSDTHSIINHLTDFHAKLVTHNPERTTLAGYAKQLLGGLGLTPEEIEKMLSMWHDENSSIDIEVPLIAQHGDATIDNVFIVPQGIALIDTDFYGEVTLPGFDLFYLLSRQENKTHNTWNSLFSNYFQAIGFPHIKITDFWLRLYIVHSLSRKHRLGDLPIAAADLVKQVDTHLQTYLWQK